MYPNSMSLYSTAHINTACPCGDFLYLLLSCSCFHWLLCHFYTGKLRDDRIWCHLHEYVIAWEHIMLSFDAQCHLHKTLILISDSPILIWSLWSHIWFILGILWILGYTVYTPKQLKKIVLKCVPLHEMSPLTGPGTMTNFFLSFYFLVCYIWVWISFFYNKIQDSPEMFL